MNKEKFKIIFLFLPLVIVFYMFISNWIINVSAPEVKFKTMAYDPYDIIRGKYLNVTIDYNNEYIVKEILGPATDDYDSYEGQFIKWYKVHDDNQKSAIKTRIKEICEYYKVSEELNYTAWDFNSDDSRPILIELFKENDYLIDPYEFRELLKKMIICENQGDDYFDIIENTNFEIMDNEKIEDYYSRYEDKKIYLYYDIDEDGFAVINKVTFNKEKNNDNYIVEWPRIYSWDKEWVKTVRITPNSKEFFIDERLASIAEDAIADARNNDKDVVIVCKNAKGNMQIKQMLIDNVDIFEYLEEYKKNLDK